MGLFVGNYTNPIDKKGRVSIPSAFRSAFGEPVKSVYVFPSVDSKRDCYLIWSETEMTQLIVKLRRGYKSLSDQEKKAAMLAIRTSRQVSVDDNGRMQLPAEVMRRLGLNASVTFVGDGFYCSLWSPDRFDVDLDQLLEARIDEGDDILMGLASDGEEVE